MRCELLLFIGYRHDLNFLLPRRRRWRFGVGMIGRTLLAQFRRQALVAH
jgi:hypothetical protein